MIQKEKQIKNILNDCIHKRHVIYLFNGSNLGVDFTKHFESCDVCKNELKYLNAQSELAKLKIPEIRFDEDLKISFNRELDELFKTLELDKKTKIQKKVKSGFKFLDQMGIDFINVAFSKKMISIYVMVTLCYVAIRIKFN